MPRSLIAQGIKEVYGNPSLIKEGVVQRYYDLSRRPGNRRGMMEIFRGKEPEKTPAGAQQLEMF